MKISEIKQILEEQEYIKFKLSDGTIVPEHFHVTEIGIITKKFIDCGGTIRTENFANFQLWTAQDYDHRLVSTKLLEIINVSEKKLGLADLEVEVEYQTKTIGRYGVMFDGEFFVLLPKTTNCLAPDKCGVSPEELPQNSCRNTGCC